ncbi:S-methyl-5'-thioadenosine phosphorylase [Halobellus ruber]|uniref:Purine nucleoside phosphorylase n=1 Tax=Halobellus ruber TaxID=2761102 RepID=A0A7J9SIZ2_9EURY|nr:S-methyl-5'-thioadenosine phosphorylase [Halobellus ruber]MBB6646343.1 S-methyl-5'-thioadenosine phosphorylase [Halobellus ruber]
MAIGFIGGSGIYDALPLENTREVDVETPFGRPAAPPTVGEFGDTGREVVFVPRHGVDHQHSPTTLPYRANIFALKELGVTHVLASNAVGSLREGLPPQTLVLPDQIYDRTKHRDLTFFEEGIVVHQQFAEPYCPELNGILEDAAESATDADVVRGGTYVCIEGPQFSTRAESEFYRTQGWDVVGMTTIPEAKLAREAELAYATIAGVTDYDVWNDDSQVSLAEVLENAAANETAIKETVEAAIEAIPEDHACDCHSALANTINTPDDAIPESTTEELEPLIGDYVE